jgi:hypothetical protein
MLVHGHLLDERQKWGQLTILHRRAVVPRWFRAPQRPTDRLPGEVEFATDAADRFTLGV